MPPAAAALISLVLLGAFLIAYSLAGPVLLLYLMAAALVLLGPILLAAGLRMLYIRLVKRIRCKAETEGHIVDYILSPWKRASMHTFPVYRRYRPRWFPVVEYEADGRKFRRKNKTCVLSDERPPEETTPLRYDPRHPKRFYLPEHANEFSSFDWMAAVMLLLAGGGFTVISVMAAVRMTTYPDVPLFSFG